MSMDDLHSDAEMMLRRYIYDYMVKKNLHTTAEIFKDEARVPIRPIEIDDSQWGFLLEWWIIFWDTYIARLSMHGVQEASDEASSVHPCSQEHYNSQFMETGSNSRNAWLENQQLKASMNLQRASSFNFSDNIFLHNYSIRHNQQIKPGYQSTNQLFGLKGNWLTQSNFLRRGQEDIRKINVMRNIQHVNMPNSQRTNFGHPSLNGSHSLGINTTAPKKNIPTFGFPHSDFNINLNANKNALGAGPSSENHTNSFQLTQLQKQLYALPEVPGLSFGSHIQSQTANRSAQIPPFVQMDKQKLTESVENENPRKRKGPSYSGNETDLGNKDVSGPSKFTNFSHASLLKKEGASKSITKSCGDEVHSETSKIQEESGLMKEKTVMETAEFLTKSMEDAQNEGPLKDAKEEGLLKDAGVLQNANKEEGPLKYAKDAGVLQDATKEGLFKDVKDEGPHEDAKEEGHMKETADAKVCRMNKGTGMETAEGLPTSMENAKDEAPLKDVNEESPLKEAKDEGLLEYHWDVHSSIAKQNCLDENRDNNHDQNKLNGCASLVDISLNEGGPQEKFEIHQSTEEESEAEDNVTVPSIIPQQDSSDGSGEKVEVENEMRLKKWLSDKSPLSENTQISHYKTATSVDKLCTP